MTPDVSDIIINAIPIPVQERYAHILDAFDRLQDGQSLRLILDHNPEGLCQELQQQRQTEANAWQQTGETEWQAVVTKR